MAKESEKIISDLIQIKEFKQILPNFSISGKSPNLMIYGNLKPSDNSNVYKIKIDYKLKNSFPKVFVIKPLLNDNEIIPHLFKDGSLCLFHYSKFNWGLEKSIVHEIIPRISLWLHYYELWLNHGVWFGDEYPHLGDKSPTPNS